MEILLPHKYRARSYQVPFWEAMRDGANRAVLVWHRRCGKDLTMWNFVISRTQVRKGNYYYFFPTYAEAKKAIWDGMDKEGNKFLDYIPKELLKNKNDTEMRIEFTNGSAIQLIGTDNFNSIMGTNPVGCVFSEFSLQNPEAWAYIRPILRENGGWAIFNFTPRGKNHGYDILQIAKKNDWFHQVLTVKDTGVLSENDIEEERKTGMSEEMIQQEYYCSFSAALVGAYYAKHITKAEEEGRIGNVVYDPILSVDTFWDLGMDDSTTIVFAQRFGSEIRIIDSYENHGQPLSHYAQVIRSKEYTHYGTHYLPHDAKARELQTGITREQFLGQMLKDPIIVLPQVKVKHGIELVKMLFPKLWINESKCSQMLEALKSYHQEYDEQRKMWKDEPYHDWSSHFADTVRYLAMAYSTQGEMQEKSFGLRQNRGTMNELPTNRVNDFYGY